jgi:hypothetical protein
MTLARCQILGLGLIVGLGSIPRIDQAQLTSGLARTSETSVQRTKRRHVLQRDMRGDGGRLGRLTLTPSSLQDIRSFRRPRTTNAAGISRPRAIETACQAAPDATRKKRHSSALTLRCESRRLSGPRDPCGGNPWPTSSASSVNSICEDRTRSQRSAVDSVRCLRCGQSSPSYML